MVLRKIVMTGLVSACLALVATAATPAASTSTTAEPHCLAVKKTIKRGQAVVWVWMEAKKGGIGQKYVVLPVRRYRGSLYSVAGYAYSGCYTAIVFRRNDRPRRLCITLRGGYKVQGDTPCPLVRKDVGGRWIVSFYLSG